MTFDLFRYTHREFWEQMEKIPGPEPSFPLGNMTDFVGKQAWEVCCKYAETYGGITKIWLGGSPALVLNDPAAIEEVLCCTDDRFYKDAPFDALAPIITAENMFIANGSVWESGRAHSPFSYALFSQWLDQIFSPLQQFVRDRIASTNGPISDVTEWVRRLAYDAFSIAIWGEELGDNSYSQFMNLASIGSHRMLELPVLQKIPPLDPSFYVLRAHWYEDFERRVGEAMKNSDDSQSTLLALTVKAGTTLDAQQLANQFSAPVYFGGVFSMASSIVYSLWCLSQAQADQTVLTNQLETVRQSETSNHRAAWMECKELDSALREALRLHPPVPLYFRNTNRNKQVSLAGHRLPPNTMLFISNWYLQRHSEHWESPQEYRPSRWADGLAQKDPLGSGFFFPFGRGPRTCVGQAFAMFFMKIALSELLLSKRLTLDPNWQIGCDYFFAVQHPKDLSGYFATT